jgi:hypothetical protein
LWIDTGAPHLMRFVKNIKSLNVFEEGRKIRNSEPFKPQGINANFVELLPDNTIFVRTLSGVLRTKHFRVVQVLPLLHWLQQARAINHL